MNKLEIINPIGLFQSVHVDMPITFGVFKPVILIPASLMFQLSPAQLEAIITHELAHIKRYDYLVNIFQSLMEVIFFYHPVFWWITKIVKEQRENACDDLAIQSGIAPKDLAYGLANVLNNAQNPAPEIAMAAAQTKNPTLDRIKRIMGIQTSRTQPTTFISMTMILTLLLGASLMVGASDQKQPNSMEDIMETSLSNQTFGGNWNGPIDLQNIDTVPPKKAIIPDKNRNNMTEEEMIEFEEKMKKSFPGFEMFSGDSLGGFVFKDFNFPIPDFSNMPMLDLDEIYLPHFEMENMPHFEFDDKHFKHFIPDSLFKNMPFDGIIMDSTAWTKHPMIIIDKRSFQMDTTKKSKEESEKMRFEMRERLEAQSEERQAYLEKMQKERETILQKYAEKQEEYQSRIQPHVKEFQDRIQKWQESNEPMLKEYKEKMKAWQEENQPKMEEFQKQMELWQKENQEQLKEFQKQMEKWQQDHAQEMQELQKAIQEQFKKGDN